MYSNEHETDIITLRYTLLQCRKQLSITIKSLFDTEYAYSKVELREDYDKLKILCEDLKSEINLLRQDFEDTIDNCQLLIQQTTDLLSERDYYYSEWKYSQNILTPRPDWDKCANLILDWKNLSIGKTSEQLVDTLINEIINDEYSSIETSSEKTNRHMRRRITGLLIKEIWSNKILNKTSNFHDYVFDYLTKRFHSKDIAIEINSNLQTSSYRYRSHYEINLFWQILTGQIEENIYHYEMKEFARILQYFLKFSSFLWTITWSDFIQGLHELYPKWTNQCLSELIVSVEKELKQSSNDTNEFEYLLLFTEDDEGHIGEFLKSIRKQLQMDKYEYIKKIKDILINHSLISIKQFKQAVKFVDPLISKEELGRYVDWVFEQNGIEIAINECCSCFMHYK